LKGYQAANAICNATFPGSHMCTSDDIINIIATRNISYFDSLVVQGLHGGWIAEGAPGYTAPMDCRGWTKDDHTYWGAVWIFESNGGGRGLLSYCDYSWPIACCW